MPHHTGSDKPRPAASADRLFFPLAALHALIAVPLWLALRPSLVPAWHGHEMLFGYALAVVAGFLVSRASAAQVRLLFATWVAARLAGACSPGIVSALLGLSFPLALLFAAAPPLLRGARRGENRIAPAVLAVLLVLDAVWWIGAVRGDPLLEQRALFAAIDVLALLILVVGGRALPAAVGGYLERRGIPRADMIRSGYELPLAALMGAGAGADLFGYAHLAGALNIAAALVTLWRARRWRLRYVFRRPELWSLALAYLWLVPALVLKGVAPAAPLAMTVVHGFTVGALGSITVVMMARTAALRARRPLAGFGVIGVAVMLVTLAAVLRLAAIPAAALPEPALWASAGAWMLAFTMLLVRLLWRNV